MFSLFRQKRRKTNLLRIIKIYLNKFLTSHRNPDNIILETIEKGQKMSFDFVDSIQARKNLMKHGTKVLYSIIEAYDAGMFDDPSLCYSFGNLLASVCEGKVQGTLDDETMRVKWSLTPEHAKKLEQEAIARQQKNVIIGPWR